jgi:hypothetical protein
MKIWFLYNGKSRLLYFLASTSAMHESCIKVKYEPQLRGFCLAFRQKEAEIISEILLKAASEPEFRNALIRDPGVLLEQYDVSPEAKLIIRRSIIDLTQ